MKNRKPPFLFGSLYLFWEGAENCKNILKLIKKSSYDIKLLKKLRLFVLNSFDFLCVTYIHHPTPTNKDSGAGSCTDGLFPLPQHNIRVDFCPLLTFYSNFTF